MNPVRASQLLLALAVLSVLLGLALLLKPAPDPLEKLAAETVCFGDMSAQPSFFPWQPGSGGDQYAARAIPVNARCGHCGMYPARTPQWAAQLIFENGTAVFFDSPLDLAQFEERSKTLIQAGTHGKVQVRYVTDYPRPGQWVKRDEAWFVVGSQVLGPMRTADVPAFARQADAQAFAQQHQGQVYAWAKLPAVVLKRYQP